VFEPVFREYPECWMWMYKHWRYLPPGAREGEYPAYANRSKKFDRLLGGR
jgi:Kdo2-lipid IVA lauroyltransferase/acyltransferase